jgi:hypothetical protein
MLELMSSAEDAEGLLDLDLLVDYEPSHGSTELRSKESCRIWFL